MSDLEVVAFERRGRLGLGAIKGGGEKNARLVDDLGETIKVSQDKVLHRFKARVADGDARAIKEKLKALGQALLAKSPGDVDLDLLWDSLEDEKIYQLGELSQVYFGETSDAHVAAIVRALGDGIDTDEPPYHFRTKPGGLARTDKETFDKIKARLEAERRRREREAAFRIWFDEGAQRARRDDRALPFTTVPDEAKEHLAVLVEYALGADRAPQAARARRLAADLAIPDPDELLVLLERGGALPKDVNELPHRAGIPINFPAKVRAEADALSGEAPVLDATKRVDFRVHLTTAIDDASTQDVDDGFSVWDEGPDLVVAIHIADVAATVPRGSAVDDEAARRATTVYFPAQIIPMIPPGLMRARLSLDAEVDRPVVSYVVRFRPDGSIAEGKFVRGIARVGRRITYDETHEPPDEWRPWLERLLPIAERLREERARAGAVLLELPDVKVELDDQGEPTITLTNADTRGHRIVSELMVLYNRALGAALRDARLAALYRVQNERPAPPSVDPDDPLFPVRARRGLPPTAIEVEPGPHRTLGVDVYVQGSSPIRRMGDLIAQRQLVSHLEGAPPAYAKDEVRELLVELERTERSARRLEADRDLYWIARYLDARRDQTFEAVVTRSPESGRGLCYLPLLHVELGLGDRDDDDVDLAEGTIVRVRVRRCSPRRRTVTLELVR